MEVLIGKKSTNSGYIWAPYIPMTTTQIISESKNISRKRKICDIFNIDIIVYDNFNPKKSLMSRYSKVLINNKFYK